MKTFQHITYEFLKENVQQFFLNKIRKQGESTGCVFCHGRNFGFHGNQDLVHRSFLILQKHQKNLEIPGRNCIAFQSKHIIFSPSISDRFPQQLFSMELYNQATFCHKYPSAKQQTRI
jgi:hypothetical protein